MANDNDPLEAALGAFSQEMSAAKLPRSDSPLPEILTRIQSIRKQLDPSQAAEQLHQVRADLIEFLRTIEQSAKQTAKESADSSSSLSTQQQERIQQRLAAIVEFAFQQVDSPKKASGGELAWLARLRV